LVLAGNALALLARLLFSEQILDVLTSRQRKQPGLRTAIITAPFFSQSSFALKVLGSGEKRQVSILSSQPSLALVEEIRNRKDVQVFSVTKENRNHLLPDIVTCVQSGWK